MIIYYRISDKSHVKEKLPGTNKIFCYKNFITFPDNKDTFIVVADNCNATTLSWLEFDADVPRCKFEVRTKNLGNARSIIYCIKDAIRMYDSEEIVYFVEDDYLHIPGSRKILEEGFLFGDYVTLYDHPDKYTKMYNYGEISKITKGKFSHWKTTQSTCMTFASKVKTLKQDIKVWEQWTQDEIPYDHKIFTTLNERKLVACIPGVASHTDLTNSIFIGKPLVEDWALQIAIDQLKFGISENDLMKLMKNETDLWAQLHKLQAYHYAIEKTKPD